MTRTKTLAAFARRQANAMGWAHPFFAIPSARVRFKEDTDGRITKTAGVSADGWIYLHTPWASKLTKAELQGLIAHELMHLILGHRRRQGNRIHRVWNIACDMTINYALKKSGFVLPGDGVYPPEKWETWHAERIYDELMAQGESQKPQDGDPAPGQGCGVMAPQGDGDPQDGEGGSQKTEAECSRQWKEIAVQAAEMGRTQGAGKDDALVGAIEVPEPRVRWSAILRKGLSTARSAHGRDSQTWTRRGRRSQAVGPQFCGWQTKAAKCAVVIDTSGSMSDDTLAQCVAEAVAISRASGVRVYLVTHDAGVQWAGWLAPNCRPEAITKALKGRGGTSAYEAYKNVANAAKRFDAFIHLTDGYLGWPQWPENTRKRIVALTGYHCDPENVRDGALVLEVDTTNS